MALLFNYTANGAENNLLGRFIQLTKPVDKLFQTWIVIWRRRKQISTTEHLF